MNTKTNLVDSFGFAFQGIKYAIKYNRNIKIHIAIALLVVFFSYILKISKFEVALVGIMILLVITTEMINTVVEEVVNLITKDYKLEAKIAKDVAAGMVLLTAIVAVIIGLFVFLPHLFS